MDNFTLAFLVIALLVLFYLCFYNAPHSERLKVGSPYGYYLKEGQNDPTKLFGLKSEKMVNENDWSLMSRGLNISNASGYTPVIRVLNEMEKANVSDIQTDNRSIDDFVFL